MNHIKKLQNLSGVPFWRYVIKHKEELQITLDNDSTQVSIIGMDEDSEEWGEYASPATGIGNGDGIFDLLAAIGIEAEYC